MRVWRSSEGVVDGREEVEREGAESENGHIARSCESRRRFFGASTSAAGFPQLSAAALSPLH